MVVLLRWSPQACEAATLRVFRSQAPHTLVRGMLQRPRRRVYHVSVSGAAGSPMYRSCWDFKQRPNRCSFYCCSFDTVPASCLLCLALLGSSVSHDPTLRGSGTRIGVRLSHGATRYRTIDSTRQPAGIRALSAPFCVDCLSWGPSPVRCAAERGFLHP